MNPFVYVIAFFTIGVPLFFITRNRLLKRKQKTYYLSYFSPKWEAVLIKKVAFFNNLNQEEQEQFKNKISLFLSKAIITGADITIDDATRILIAASAIIPVFHLDKWEYTNMGEIIVYRGNIPSTLLDDPNRRVALLGQVRPFQTKQLVLLSKESLEDGFQLNNTKSNVGIHEFIHLLDQSDGTIDGVPDLIMPEVLKRAWSSLMFEEIERIENGISDINPYGLTNHAEFFAVVCEYFFGDPEEFKKKHPEMNAILMKVFQLDATAKS